MKRQIIVEGDLAYVPLTRGLVSVIDASDVALVDGYNWSAKLDGRAVYGMRTEVIGNGKQRCILLHRAILGLTDPDIYADHIDMDGLNNRRSNLRECSIAENMRNRVALRTNSSGYKGVSWDAARQKWRALIKVSGSRKHLGYFDSAVLAHAAYCAAAVDLHGEFARAA